MARLKATVAYDGTRFSGYQVQPNKRTVQLEIEAALTRMHKGKKIFITASGRTDAGVHARAQVFHFDSPYQIPDENWKKALNVLLPDDVYIKHVTHTAENFHARYDVVQKEYRYRLLRGAEGDMFRRLYTLHFGRPLDLKAMQSAAREIVGTHDFTSFCASQSSVKDKVRTVTSCDIISDGDEWVICVTGTGFLYQMVRIIVGTLLDAGQGKLMPEDIRHILEQKDRRAASITAPPQGLHLWSVNYENAL